MNWIIGMALVFYGASHDSAGFMILGFMLIIFGDD